VHRKVRKIKTKNHGYKANSFCRKGTDTLRHVFHSGPYGSGKGTGIYMAVADLRGTGRKDIVAAGKDGLYIFYNEGIH
jgi:hypothetical protein